MKKAPVVHFEMPAKDKKRAAEFYTKALGWNMQLMGEEFGGYLMAQTSDTDEKGMNKTPGTINGGFFDYKDEPGFNAPHLVVSVENIEEAVKAVEDAGGKVLPSLTGEGKTAEIQGIGTYASFKDTEDNIVGLLQPAPREN